MKVIFISEYFDEKGQGSYQLAHSHYQSICNIFNKENVDVISIKLSNAVNSNKAFRFLSGFESRKDRLMNMLCGYPPFYSGKVEDEILEVISSGIYSLIFFDNSYFGGTIKKIKKSWPNMPVFIFYHGVCANSGKQTVAYKHYKPNVILMSRNNIKHERLSVQYGDAQILLNSRDESELVKHYGTKADLILPIYLQDSANIQATEKRKEEFRVLFVGGFFWPNILGITWFAENVMYNVDGNVKLFIVGRGMEKLRDMPEFKDRNNIEVIGGTDDLDFWYNSADIVIGPIFHGEGMKTKTAESLMYGKGYLGTKEALCGYVGLENCHCETAQEFIHRINEYVRIGIPRYIPRMRLLFDEYYSMKSADNLLRILLKEKGIFRES